MLPFIIALSLSVDGTTAGGRWEIRDAAGHFCASGSTASGQTRIDVPKIDQTSELSVVVRRPSGEVHHRLTVPSKKKISTMGRPDRAAIIYQVPMRTYLARGVGAAQTGRLEHFTDAVFEGIKAMGTDYIWLTGLLEASSPDNTDPDVVKGDAGSYYAITDMWDVNPQVGTLADFDTFLGRAHAAGLRVIIDYVPNHTARVHRTDVACKQDLEFGRNDDKGAHFTRDNNYFYIQGSVFEPPLGAGGGRDGQFDTDIFTPGLQLEDPAKATGNNVDSPRPRSDKWYETVKLNYGYDFTTGRTDYHGTPKTWVQMLDVAKYWLDKGVDGFRLDVAHSVPVEYWRYFVRELREVKPDAFLLAEAYESDTDLRAPNFSYEALYDAGMDSVFNSELYGRLRSQGETPGRMYGARLGETPALRPYMVRNGYMFTNFMENHDEVRLASHRFAPRVGDWRRRAELGRALAAFAALLPGHWLIHGGQEVREDASVMGGFSGDNGRTSIFDFVHQAETRKWFAGQRSSDMVAFRDMYKRLSELKNTAPFNLPHTAAQGTFVDLHDANWMKSPQSLWIGAYLRHSAEGTYLVVTNSDPVESREATIHFTHTSDADPLGALAAAKIQNGNKRYKFVETFARPGWAPTDPNVPGQGLPGWALYQKAGVPSGLYLGAIPPATTYVFKVEPID